MAKLKMYSKLLEPQELVVELTGDPTVEQVELAHTADLSKLKKAIDSAVKKKVPKGKESQLDVDLTRAVHEAFRHLPEDVTRDMRFWQWLTVSNYPQFVARRWLGRELPQSIDELEELVGRAPAKRARFLGSNSLSGYARNALSRLFFAAEALHSSNNQYKLVNAVFVNQDRQTAIFEREYGLLTNVVRALTAVSLKGDGKFIQRIAKRLNHIATTVDLALLSESEIKSLVS